VEIKGKVRSDIASIILFDLLSLSFGGLIGLFVGTWLAHCFFFRPPLFQAFPPCSCETTSCLRCSPLAPDYIKIPSPTHAGATLQRRDLLFKPTVPANEITLSARRGVAACDPATLEFLTLHTPIYQGN